MFESVDAQTDTRTPAQVPSYKLTLWAYRSGELKCHKNAEPEAYIKSFNKLECYLSTWHQENMSVQCMPPYTPLLYSKTRVYMVIHFLFLI